MPIRLLLFLFRDGMSDLQIYRVCVDGSSFCLKPEQRALIMWLCIKGNTVTVFLYSNFNNIIMLLIISVSMIGFSFLLSFLFNVHRVFFAA